MNEATVPSGQNGVTEKASSNAKHSFASARDARDEARLERWNAFALFRDFRFRKLPKDVRPLEVMVLLTIVDLVQQRATARPATLVWKGTLETLCAWVGLGSKRTLNRSLGRLRDHGWCAVRNRGQWVEVEVQLLVLYEALDSMPRNGCWRTPANRDVEQSASACQPHVVDHRRCRRWAQSVVDALPNASSTIRDPRAMKLSLLRQFTSAFAEMAAGGAHPEELEALVSLVQARLHRGEVQVYGIEYLRDDLARLRRQKSEAARRREQSMSENPVFAEIMDSFEGQGGTP